MSTQTDRKDVYTRVTDRIIFDLEQGIRTWMKPWSVEHTAGRISKPLRHNGTPYRGMNILLLWGEALAKGDACPPGKYDSGIPCEVRSKRNLNTDSNLPTTSVAIRFPVCVRLFSWSRQ